MRIDSKCQPATVCGQRARNCPDRASRLTRPTSAVRLLSSAVADNVQLSVCVKFAIEFCRVMVSIRCWTPWLPNTILRPAIWRRRLVRPAIARFCFAGHITQRHRIAQRVIILHTSIEAPRRRNRIRSGDDHRYERRLIGGTELIATRDTVYVSPIQFLLTTTTARGRRTPSQSPCSSPTSRFREQMR